MAAIGKFDKKLDALGAAFDAHSKRDQEQLDVIAKWAAKIDARFEGTDANTNPGLTVRVDRLEQKQAERGRAFWWALGIFGTVLATEAGFLLHYIFSRG